MIDTGSEIDEEGSVWQYLTRTEGRLSGVARFVENGNRLRCKEPSTIKGRHVIVTVLLSRSYRKILVSTIKVAKTLDVNVPGITYAHTYLVAESRFERREHDPHEID